MTDQNPREQLQDAISRAQQHIQHAQQFAWMEQHGKEMKEAHQREAALLEGSFPHLAAKAESEEAQAPTETGEAAANGQTEALSPPDLQLVEHSD